MRGFYVEGEIQNITKELKQVFEQLGDHEVVYYKDCIFFVANKSSDLIYCEGTAGFYKTVKANTYAICLESYSGDKTSLTIAFNVMLTTLGETKKHDILNDYPIFYI